jgi:hypothetical protein
MQQITPCGRNSSPPRACKGNDFSSMGIFIGEL